MKTTLRPVLFFASLFAAITLTAQTFNPTSAANGFNVFLQNNFTATGGSIEGSVAMGGDLILNGSTIFAMNSSGTYPTGTLNQATNYGMVVGGKISFTAGNSSQVNQGYLRLGNATGARIFYTDCNNAGTNLKLTPYNADCNTAFNSYPNLMLQRQQTNGTATTAHGLDFTSAFTDFAQYNTVIDSYSGSGLTELNAITIPSTSNPHLTLQDNKINYINLTPAQLNNLTSLGSIIFDNKPTATRLLVFNISGTEAVNWNMSNFGGLGNTEGSYIIWNFYGVTTLSIQGSNPIFGTVFAPTADVTKSSNNNLYGQVIAKSLIMQPGQINYYPFRGNLPNNTQNLTALPVKLLSFTGFVANNIAELRWSLAQNETFNYAEIEKSTGNTGFTLAGRVFATAKSGTETYSFKEAIAGKCYYRLKFVDNNGSTSYSTILLLQTENKTNNALTVLQNPIVSTLNFQYTAGAKSNTEVTLLTNDGKVVFRKNVTVEKGVNTLSIAVGDDLPKGLYFLDVKNEGNRTVAKILK